MEDHQGEEPIAQLARLLIEAYLKIGKLLMRLPITIGLPPVEGKDGIDGQVAADAIQRAREVLDDMPMDDMASSMIDKLLLHWLIAQDLGALILIMGEEEWRLEAMGYSLLQVSVLLQMAELRLSQE
ncbi:hypothetical protein [Sphaerisporangium aureirubrum]|uniref:Uncharacterized protein n=1 Tax=Sphaerisporangium aureirubrum TaxID=1544736 RepID=A0ABW1NC81_9ACTN